MHKLHPSSASLLIGLLLSLANVPLIAQNQTARATPRAIAASTRPAVVLIKGFDSSNRLLGQGTGFFVTSDGVLVTNYHVIEDANLLQVHLHDGAIYANVFLITTDPLRDLAILKIPVEGVQHLRFGRDSDLQVGDDVYVMGNPLGLEGTFSNGLVSAWRSLEGIHLLQISAPISPGSSGGPVLNTLGEVIGVATLSTTVGQNLNMAVPARYVRPLLTTGEQPRRFGGLTSSARRPSPNTQPIAPPRPTVPSPRTTPRTADPYEAQVLEQLATFEVALTNNGFIRSHEIFTGELRRNRSDEVEIRLIGGRTYAIIGVCDVDCRDLDLRLYSPAGRLLESDVQVSAFPRLFYAAPFSGNYVLRVTMSGCSVEPCSFGVASYVQ